MKRLTLKDFYDRAIAKGQPEEMASATCGFEYFCYQLDSGVPEEETYRCNPGAYEKDADEKI